MANNRSISLPKEVEEMAEKQAKKEFSSFSGLIKNAIIEYCEKRKTKK